MKCSVKLNPCPLWINWGHLKKALSVIIWSSQEGCSTLLHLSPDFHEGREDEGMSLFVRREQFVFSSQMCTLQKIVTKGHVCP